MSYLDAPFLLLADDRQASEWEGRWIGFLETPGGDLEFGLDLQRDSHTGRWSAAVINGPQRIDLSDVHVDVDRCLVRWPHYDSTMEIQWVPGELSRALGTWSKRRSATETARLQIRLLRPSLRRHDDNAAFLGRWRVEFQSGKDPAIAILQAGELPNQVVGTFLSPTGDYGYLSGYVQDAELRLFGFDGAHAFLFRSRIDTEGKMLGEFWSGTWWHDTWTAELDPTASLPDPFGLTVARSGMSLTDLSFPDVEGNFRSLGDPQFLGRVTIVELFGSWCPNCHDAARWLEELRREYTGRDLKILGLAFELTGDVRRDTEQVRLYIEKHALSYPVLLAGVADKQKAAEKFPILERIKAFPTFLFLDRHGTARAIYTGFSGPATGQAYQDLQTQFRRTVEDLLREDRQP